jgi:hypothetical protein
VRGGEVSGSLRDALTGAWELVDVIERGDDDAVRRPFGERPLGLILYTPDGYMSAQLMPRETGAAGWETYFAYSGSYSVDEDAGTVTHSVVVSLRPDWIGTEQIRVATVQGDELELATASPSPSGMPDPLWAAANEPLVRTIISWRRAASRDLPAR